MTGEMLRVTVSAVADDDDDAVSSCGALAFSRRQHRLLTRQSLSLPLLRDMSVRSRKSGVVHHDVLQALSSSAQTQAVAGRHGDMGNGVVGG